MLHYTGMVQFHIIDVIVYTAINAKINNRCAINDVVEGHFYIVDVGHTDCEQILGRINDN